jgi:hypothetical protein
MAQKVETKPSMPMEAPKASKKHSPVKLIGPGGQAVFGLYFVLLVLGLGAFLYWLWGFNFDQKNIERELRYIGLVAGAGALGGFVHAATSFTTYAGDRSLGRSWTWWYILRPFIGAALALVMYFVLRGGLMVPAANITDTLNPFTLVAVAGLIGMFSKQATDKLNEIATVAFRVPDDQGDAKRDDKLGLASQETPAPQPNPTPSPQPGSK